MPSPYKSIFDETEDLDPDDKRRIGLATATLILSWPQWLHRRVELVTFEDRNVIRRKNSFDFTVPRRIFNVLGVHGSTPINVAVPLTFVRKGELIHLNLSSEGSDAVPLLSKPQLAALSEAALLATVEIVLGQRGVPAEIACDIRRLVRDWVRFDPATSQFVGPAIEARERLFSENEPTPQARTLLYAHSVFRSLAYDFSTQFMAAVLLPISLDKRRVVHFAYDEPFFETDGLFRRLRSLLRLSVGKWARIVPVFASGPSETASYHFEAEAPEGLQISSGEVYSLSTGEMIEEKIGSFQRIHFHTSRPSPRGIKLAVALHLRPRSSTIVRAATLTSVLTMLGIVYVRIQFGAITNSKGTQGAAAALLVVPILLSLYLVRTNEHPMTTQLLWPLRIVATAPGLLSLLAAGVLVGSLSQSTSEWALVVIAGFLAIGSGILGLTWLQTYRREHRRKP